MRFTMKTKPAAAFGVALAETVASNAFTYTKQSDLTEVIKTPLALSSGESTANPATALQAAEDYDPCNRRAAAEASANGLDQASQARLLFIAACGAPSLVSLISTLLVSVSIGRGLKQAVDMAYAVAVGDLNVKTTKAGDDEIGDLVRALFEMIAPPCFRRSRASFPKARPSGRRRLKKRPRQRRKCRPASNRAPTTPARPKRSRAPRRMRPCRAERR